MKPMIALIIFGLGTLAICGVIAYNNFDGVVEAKTYEASLQYDQTTADVKSVENAVGKINVSKDGKITSLTIDIDSSKTAYPEITVESVSIARPLDVAIALKHSGNGFFTEDSVEKGWYNVAINLNAGGKNINVTKSIHLE